MRSLRNFLLQRTKAFLKNKGGASAVEFALILPVMVVIYMSTVEISMAIAAQRRVAIAAGTVGDLAAQYETMNNDNISLILNSSYAVLLPYDPADMTVDVKSIVVDSNGDATVDWGYYNQRTGHVDSGATADADVGNPYNSLPGDLVIPDTSVIVASIDYTYTSPVGALLPGNKHFTQTVYFRPRLGSKIPWQSSNPTPPTWPLPTSGDDGTQLNPTYIGFGPEYMIPPRTIERTDNSNVSTDAPPQDLQDAWTCETTGSCGGGGGGGGIDNGEGGAGCYVEEPLTREVYLCMIN